MPHGHPFRPDDGGPFSCRGGMLHASGLAEVAMDRRTILARATLGAAGLALAGSPYDIRRRDQGGRERSACAIPDAPRGRLDRQQIIWSVPTREPVLALTVSGTNVGNAAGCRAGPDRGAGQRGGGLVVGDPVAALSR